MRELTAAALRPSSMALPGLFLVALFFLLNEAGSLLTPIVIACLISLLLSPLVRTGCRLGIPASISALVLIGGLLAGTIGAINYLSEPAEQWLQEVPETLRQLRGQVRKIDGPLGDLQRVSEEVDTLTDSIAEAETRDRPVPVAIDSSSLTRNLLDGALGFFAAVSIVVFLSYFLLAGGDDLLRKVTMLGRTFDERRRIVQAVRRIQSDVSVHLGTVTVINFFLGLSVAAVMYVLEVPNPMLWGAMAGILNFAPYLGSMVSVAVLTLVGIATFPDLDKALLVPTIFLLLTMIEGQLVTPSVLGQRLSLSPTVVFASVVVWGWLWGVAGALIAVPVTAAIKVVFEHMPSYRVWARSMDRS